MTVITFVVTSLMTVIVSVGLIFTGINYADIDQIDRSIVGAYNPEGE